MKPKNVSIGPIKYTVSYDADRCDDLEYVNGFIKCDEAEIIIHPARTDTVMRRVLLHEILHGLFDLAGFQSGREPVLNDKSEEEIINILAPLLLDTLKRNKKVTEYLLEV